MVRDPIHNKEATTGTVPKPLSWEMRYALRVDTSACILVSVVEGIWTLSPFLLRLYLYYLIGE